jgi:hypothetical protein
VSILFVAAVFLLIATQIPSRQTQNQISREIQDFARLEYINFEDSLDQTVFLDAYELFYPEKAHESDSLIRLIQDYKHRLETTSWVSQTFSLYQILIMYIKFVFIYSAVLALTYYGVHSLGIWRFIREKQGKDSYMYLLVQKLIQFKNHSIAQSIKTACILLFKATAKGVLYLLLFSPAYVIAYSFRTRFDTNSVIFMVALGVISNAFLITYIHKFYSFLVAESRKGYVETSIVKNLDQSYDSISYREIFRFRKSFQNHVFDHIYENARYQFYASVKEQASFLITGLVIIEMALNIHEHLCYTLLQTILYQQYHSTLIIVFALFFLVKMTEMIIDRRMIRLARYFDNQPAIDVEHS